MEVFERINSTYVLLVSMSLGLVMMSSSCHPEEDHYIYGLQEAVIETTQVEKRHLKSMSQYIAVLHSNLFQRGINPAELQDVERAIASLGDKTLAKRMVISNFLRRPDAQVPGMDEMRQDVEGFIRQTYIRFLIREPLQGELIFMKNFIQSRPELEPHIIYTTFALSNEYQFY